MGGLLLCLKVAERPVKELGSGEVVEKSCGKKRERKKDINPASPQYLFQLVCENT